MLACHFGIGMWPTIGAAAGAAVEALASAAPRLPATPPLGAELADAVSGAFGGARSPPVDAGAAFGGARPPPVDAGAFGGARPPPVDAGAASGGARPPPALAGRASGSNGVGSCALAREQGSGSRRDFPAHYLYR